MRVDSDAICMGRQCETVLPNLKFRAYYLRASIEKRVLRLASVRLAARQDEGLAQADGLVSRRSALSIQSRTER